MATQPDAVVVFITASNIEEAQRLAEILIEQKLAACVQILPQMQSIYRWQGKIERQLEVLLIVKTRRSMFEKLTTTVRREHTYENPEIVALPIIAGSAAYLEWLNSNLEADTIR